MQEFNPQAAEIKRKQIFIFQAISLNVEVVIAASGKKKKVLKDVLQM